MLTFQSSGGIFLIPSRGIAASAKDFGSLFRPRGTIRGAGRNLVACRARRSVAAAAIGLLPKSRTHLAPPAIHTFDPFGKAGLTAATVFAYVPPADDGFVGRLVQAVAL